MIGMAIAIGTTLAGHPPADGLASLLVVLGIAIGGSIGAVIARQVPMTSMPELVAAFHSLVGMAPVLVSAGAFYAPEAATRASRGLRRSPCRISGATMTARPASLLAPDSDLLVGVGQIAAFHGISEGQCKSLIDGGIITTFRMPPRNTVFAFENATHRKAAARAHGARNGGGQHSPTG